MIINLTFNSDDKSLSVTKDGSTIGNLSSICFYSRNEAGTKFSVDMTEVTRKAPDEDGYREIDTVTTTSAAEKLAKSLMRYAPDDAEIGIE